MPILATTTDLPEFTLNDEPVMEVSYARTVNEGHKWSAMVEGVQPIGSQMPMACVLEWENGHSPPLIASEAECICLDDAGIVGWTVYSGTDKTSYLLGMEGLSSPTLHNFMAADIINTVSALSTTLIVAPNSTSVSITKNLDGTYTVTYVNSSSGTPVLTTSQISLPANSYIPVVGLEDTPLGDMRVEQFDIQGGTIGTYITRLLKDAGCNYRIDNNGNMVIFSTNPTGSGDGSVPHGEMRRKMALSQKYTQIWAKKSSRARGVYGIPVTKSGMHTGDERNQWRKQFDSI